MAKRQEVDWDQLRTQVGQVDSFIAEAERRLEGDNPDLSALDEAIADSVVRLNNTIRSVFNKTPFQ